MVQREVADRFFAEPSTKAYGAVSVLVQLAARRTGFHPVARTVFRPPPNVDSALVAFRRVPLPERFERIKAVVEASFAHRRKTLPNSLALAGLADREQRGRGARVDRAARRDPGRGARAGGVRRARRGAVKRAPAPAKINLALVVGPAREDGKHEVATVLQRIDLGDRVAIARRAEPAGDRLRGRHARSRRARPRSPRPRASSRAGGRRSPSGSRSRPASAAAAPTRRPRFGSPTTRSPRRCPASACARSRPRSARTSRSSSRPGRSSAAGTAPSSSRSSCRRTTGSSSRSRTAPARTRPRPSTGASTSATARRAGRSGAPRSSRRSPPCGARAISPPCRRTTSPPRRWPPSCSGSGAFRADVSGAGPTVYGLFHHRRHAEAARRALRRAARTWLTVPTWYG